jgi:hypothetical protein
MQKVLVATKQTQGTRKNDFFNCKPFEFVHFAMECDGERVDGSCGCRRSMIGFESGTATTTILVAERPVDFKDYAFALHKAYRDSGWGDVIGLEDATEEARELTKIADYFEVGDVIEKRGSQFVKRTRAVVSVS